MLKCLQLIKFNTIVCASLLLFAFPSYSSLPVVKHKQLDEYVGSLVSQVSSLLNNLALSEEKKIEACKELLEMNLDLRWMGKFVLGRYKRGLSESQISDFQTVYSRYVTKTYSELVKNYKGERAVVKRVQQLGADEYIVKTEVVRTNGQPPIKADYLIHEYKTGNNPTFKVADVITEGVSMVNSQQSEFASIIASNGFEGLRRELQKKIN